MKRVLVGISIIFAPFFLFAQDNGLITVKKSELPADLIQKLEQQNKLQEIKQNMDTIKQMASVGKEIGIAINDGLAAVTDQTARFSKTDAGKFTMFLIAWKVMAKDVKDLSGALLGVLFGVPFLIFVNLFMIWIWKRVTNKKRVVIEENGKEKKYQYIDTWYTEEKQYNEGDFNEKLAFVILWWAILLIANVWIVAGVIF